MTYRQNNLQLVAIIIALSGCFTAAKDELSLRPDGADEPTGGSTNAPDGRTGGSTDAANGSNTTGSGGDGGNDTESSSSDDSGGLTDTQNNDSCPDDDCSCTAKFGTNESADCGQPGFAAGVEVSTAAFPPTAASQVAVTMGNDGNAAIFWTCRSPLATVALCSRPFSHEQGFGTLSTFASDPVLGGVEINEDAERGFVAGAVPGGDALVYFLQALSLPEVYSVPFSATTGWGQATRRDADFWVDGSYALSASDSGDGQMVVSWQTYDVGDGDGLHAHRYVEVVPSDGTQPTQLHDVSGPTTAASVGIDNSGRAILVDDDGIFYAYDGIAWSPQETSESAQRPVVIGNGGHALTGSQQLAAFDWDAGTWTSPEAVAANDNAHTDIDGQGNALTVWSEGKLLEARRYSAEDDSWSELSVPANAGQDITLLGLDVSPGGAGLAYWIDDDGMAWAQYYAPASGFGEATLLEGLSDGATAVYVEGALDAEGLGLVAVVAEAADGKLSLQAYVLKR